MTDYRTLTINGILAPTRARTADIWVDANIFEPWVSGTAHFDDFSVTTLPRSLRFKVMVGTAGLRGIPLDGTHQTRSRATPPSPC